MTASPIRDGAGKLAITPGVWEIDYFCGYLSENRKGCGIYKTNGTARIATVHEPVENSALANAALIAESGTVTNQTGRTPAELAALVRELREALNEIVAQYDWQARTASECGAMELANEALAKSEGV
jgi:hypothetical protein